MAQTLTIRPMQVGAEILGLSPGSESDPAVAAALHEAWLAYGVLLFRNIESTAQHLAVSRLFGELELHPLVFMRSKEEPLLMELGGNTSRGPAFVYDDADMRLGRIPWHRDTAYTPNICKGAMLRMLAVPSSDGETMVADTAMAYDDLSPEMKTRLESLEYTTSLHPMDQTGPGALWKTIRTATPQEDPEAGNDPHARADGPTVIHPALMTHPESGRKCIFLSLKDALYFVDMSKQESDELLRELADHMTNPRYVYKHSWKVDDALLWDNRRIMHAAMGYKVGQPRWAVRTTLAGPLRTGRYLDGSTDPELAPTAMD